MPNLATCNVNELCQLLARDPATQIIDVREYSEHAAERLAGAKLLSLSALDQNCKEINPQQTAYLLCRSGARATQAANKLTANGFDNLIIVEGGLMAWKAAGLPVEAGSSKVWSLERQVRFTAGLFVLLGVLLSYFVHPYFIALSGFIGAGLVFSSVTDTCGMGMILAKMPWNQRPTNCAS